MWKEIAEQYKQELEILQCEARNAQIELEKRVPKSFQKGIYCLESAIDKSKSNLQKISYEEPTQKVKSRLKHIKGGFYKNEKNKPKTNDDPFDWINRFTNKKITK